MVFANFGGYRLEPGKGISYDESGQLFSPDAPGNNPNLKGHYDAHPQSTPDPRGNKEFDELFLS